MLARQLTLESSITFTSMRPTTRSIFSPSFVANVVHTYPGILQLVDVSQ
jgi:hypothetical protein